MKRLLLLSLLLAAVLAEAETPASIYPRKDLTPGDVMPAVTAAQVCVHGYSATVRNVPDSLKKAVFARYGMNWSERKCCEVDHFVSLELGGTNDITNLWPEPYEPRPGAHEKDVAENSLHWQVCHGGMTLQEAQRTIMTDWYAVYRKAKEAK